MTFLKKICIGVLILSFLGLHFPRITLAAESHYFAQTATITEHLPEMLASPAEQIPVEEMAKKKSRTWLWVLGGALLVGVIAAAGGGGGGGDGDPGKGDVEVQW